VKRKSSLKVYDKKFNFLRPPILNYFSFIISERYVFTLHLLNVRIYTIHCKTTERLSMRTMDQTNSSRFIPPLQYNLEVKNVCLKSIKTEIHYSPLHGHLQRRTLYLISVTFSEEDFEKCSKYY
jgi:hypothetical protein